MGSTSTLIVPSKRVVLLPYDDARRVKWLDHIEHEWVRYRGEKRLVLPHNLETAWKLAADGIKVPGPIRHYYEWAGRYTPYKHQLETADFLTRHWRCFVFNDMGTGKTASSLWATDFLRQQGAISRVLIISPLSTLERVWGDEIFKMRVGEYGTIYGAKSQRERVIQTPYDYYVINPDGLKVFASFDGRQINFDPLFQEFLRGIDLVLIDECAVFRNAKTDRWRVLNKILEDDRKRAWLMSGSPMPNQPTDIWAQARLVSKDLVPRYFGKFRDQVMHKVSQFKWVPKKDWEQTVFAMVQPSIRYRLEECIDLPPMVEETRGCELTAEQKRIEKKLLREFRIELKEGSITTANEGVRRMKLHQLYGGIVYGDGGTPIETPCPSRLTALHEAIEEAGNKAIVFAPYTHMLDYLARYLSKHWMLGVVFGGVSAGKRDQIFSEFQGGDLQVLLAHPGTMAHGLTLTASSTVIWYSPIDDFEIYEQANRRIRRPSQTKTQVVTHIEASKLERSMYERLRKKRSMQGLLLELLES